MLRNLKKIQKALILVILFLGVDASAVYYMLNEERVLELSLASDAPTRIGIDGKKIKDVFFYLERSAVMAAPHEWSIIYYSKYGTEQNLYDHNWFKWQYAGYCF